MWTVGQLREALADVPGHWQVDIVTFRAGISTMQQLYIPYAQESSDPYDEEWEAGRIPAVEFIA